MERYKKYHTGSNELSIRQNKNASNKWYNDECRAVVEKRSKAREKYMRSNTRSIGDSL